MGIESIAGTFLIVYFAVILLIVGLNLFSFLLKAFGMYQMGKNRGIQNPWMAFVPYATVYFQGELCGDIKFKRKDIAHPGAWLLGLLLGGGLVVGTFTGVTTSMLMVSIFKLLGQSGFYEFRQFAQQYTVRGGTGIGLWSILFLVSMLIAAIVGLCTVVLRVLVNQQIYARYTTESLSVAHAVLSLFVPFYEAFLFFIYRNRTVEGEIPAVPQAEYAPVQQPMPESVPLSRTPQFDEETGQPIVPDATGEAGDKK